MNNAVKLHLHIACELNINCVSKGPKQRLNSLLTSLFFIVKRRNLSISFHEITEMIMISELIKNTVKTNVIATLLIFYIIWDCHCEHYKAQINRK